MRYLILLAAAASLAACQQAAEEPAESAPEPAAAEPAAEPAPTSGDALAAALDAQADEAKARYGARHPRETIEFFEIEPGMTVVEALPGGGWYTKILLPYLGSDGTLVGANYAHSIWPLFGFFDQEFIDGMATWTTDFPVEAEEWRGADSASLAAFEFGSMPDDMAGTADRVLLVRAMHNLNRFEGDGGYMTSAIQDTYNVLKPGGIVGVVQHQAPDDKPHEWADGSRGYLKKDALIEKMTAAGFEFVGESPVNENPADQPGDDDMVWRLPPTYFGTGEDPEMKAAVDAIGESNRMTLKFRKP